MHAPGFRTFTTQQEKLKKTSKANNTISSKKLFLLGGLFGLVLLIVYFFTLPDGKLHIVFCDVGQGDGTYIRTPNNLDLLIDGGPDKKILGCLGRHMPFYDKTIDVAVLTHPQSDHMKGLLYVLDRFKVKNFIIGIEGNGESDYRQLTETLKMKKIPVKNLYLGDSFSLGRVKLDILWPDKKWAFNSIANSAIGNQKEPVLGMATDIDINNFSYYLQLNYDQFDALFTGDGDSRIQPVILEASNLTDVEVLKFPHHGSKYGILPEVLDKLKPEFAVISVGKNPWGMPTKETITLLTDREIKYRRTDKDGDIEIVSDGKNWGVN